MTEERLHSKIISEAFTIITSFGWRPNEGHMAVEAKPDIDWNKGMNQ